MPTQTLGTSREKSLQFSHNVNRHGCLNMWRLRFTSDIRAEKTPALYK